MNLQHEFDVPGSPQATLELLLDAERVVPCLPGASLVEVADDGTWKTAMTVKLGPVVMEFANDVRIVENDPALTKRVYDESAEPEQKADAEMKGGAMLVDIDRVIQRNMVVIARDPAEVNGEFTVPVPSVPAPAR